MKGQQEARIPYIYIYKLYMPSANRTLIATPVNLT